MSVASPALLALAACLAVGAAARASSPSPDAMSIDMDPAGAPANTATSLGTREACARIDENNTLDADEDVTADTLSLDVTATSIPASNPVVGLNYVLNYDEQALTVQAADHQLLLSSTPGSAVFDASDPLPDQDANNAWTGIALDVSDYNTVPTESGSGVLGRLNISSDPAAAPGQYPLTLTEAAVFDAQGGVNQPVAINNAAIAVDRPCPVLQGDVDCSGAVNATDALKVLRFVAGLAVTQDTSCPVIGAGGPPAQGDVDCSGAVAATDALKVLRFVAGLPVAQTQPCTPVGTMPSP